MFVLFFGLVILLMKAFANIQLLVKEREQFQLALGEGEAAEATIINVHALRGSWTTRLFGRTTYSHRVGVYVDGVYREDDLYGVPTVPLGQPGDIIDVALYTPGGDDDVVVVPRHYDFAAFLRHEVQYVFVEYALYALLVVVVWWFLPG